MFVALGSRHAATGGPLAHVLAYASSMDASPRVVDVETGEVFARPAGEGLRCGTAVTSTTVGVGLAGGASSPKRESSSVMASSRASAKPLTMRDKTPRLFLGGGGVTF